MKSKALIFDIDGTAIDSPVQKAPTERLVEAVRGIERDYFVCAATGRGRSFAMPVLKGLALVDPCIVSGGSQICNPTDGTVLWQSDIDKADLEAVLNIAKSRTENRVLVNDYEEDAYIDQGGFDPAGMRIDSPVYFFEFVFIAAAEAPKIAARLSEIEGIAVTMTVAQRPGLYDIHVTNRAATKEHAVAELLKMLGVDRKNTIGVGDNHNDIHLFNAVERKIAMENAVDELKAAANEVIGHVKKDGLAAYLEDLGR